MTAPADSQQGPKSPSGATAADVAASLGQARAGRTLLPPLSDRFGAFDLAFGYAVQAEGLCARVATDAHVGWKVGMTGPAAQTMFGVTAPIRGPLFASGRLDSALPVPPGRLLQPKFEAEIAFGLARPLTGRKTLAEVLAAIDFVAPAFELPDTAIANWKGRAADVVADLGGSGAYVVGAPRAPKDVALDAIEVRIAHNGTEAGSGVATSLMGHPAAPLVWLAEALADTGGIAAGAIVLTGSIGPVLSVAPGDRFAATWSGLGELQLAFAA